jgi:non-specific serine/threonine protein kinase/serine/threonine-protein kinase
MKAENWKNIKEVLLEAMSLESSERWDYLEKADISPETREEVKSLLAFEAESEDLMHLSAVEFSKDFFESDDELKNILIGQQIGAYTIVSELDNGGMGAVYLASRTDGKFKQKVALKLLKREMNTAALRQRFRQEREILASLEHPNVARLLDAGTTEDQIPFIAMEYVEGLPIDEYCNRRDLNLVERLNLFRTICATVNFAHRNLIVHRDLKPSNILVTEEGIPKLLDFGISKILSTEIENINAATVTRLGVMTPSYASPEQLRGESVTTATDIYSLGVILYELLSGHRPFENKEANLKEIYQAVIDTDPPLPSTIMSTRSKSLDKISSAPSGMKFSENSLSSNKTKENDFLNTQPQTLSIKPQFLRGDLDNIVLKALKKEPERRYSSAENFSEDIKRHLDGLPVSARPDTFSYRTEKFIKRNSFSVAAGTLILLAITGGVVATLWQARVAQAERVKAESRFNDVRKLANSFLFEFSPLIENLPGSTPARKLLVERALEYLDNLSQEMDDDFELRRELAKAYEKVGDVQGNPYNPNLGDIKGALESYEKARLIRQQLSDKEPENSVMRGDLANNLKLIGEIHSNGGDYDKAVGFYDQALVLQEKLIEQNPNDFASRAKLAELLRARGLIPFFEGDNKKAIEYYVRAKAINEQLHNEQPENPKIAEHYAYNFVAIGEAQGWDSDFEGASKNLQTGLDMLIRLGEKYPNDFAIQRSLMLAHNKKAENYQDLKDFEKSVALFSRGVEIAQISAKADPQNLQAKRDVAMGNKKLAQALDDAGKSRESLEKLTLALNIFQEIAAADPNNTEAPYDVANTRFSIGETYLTLKDYESALETFLRAKEEFQTVLATSPRNIYAVRMSSYNLNRLGKCYAALAEKRNRRAFFEHALENLRAALNNFNKLKNEGNLGEVDTKEISEMEKEIAAVENKTLKIF